MFILTPIAINSSLTSKWAHVYIVIAITTSLVFHKIPKVFPLTVVIGFPNVREKEKGLKPPFHYLRAMSISPSEDVILKIPMVKMCGNESRTTYKNFTTIQWLINPGS